MGRPTVPGVLYGDPLDRIIAEFASGVCQDSITIAASSAAASPRET